MGAGSWEQNAGPRKKRQDVGQALASKTLPIRPGTRGQYEAIWRDSRTHTHRATLRTSHNQPAGAPAQVTLDGEPGRPRCGRNTDPTWLDHVGVSEGVPEKGMERPGNASTF